MTKTGCLVLEYLNFQTKITYFVNDCLLKTATYGKFSTTTQQIFHIDKFTLHGHGKRAKFVVCQFLLWFRTTLVEKPSKVAYTDEQTNMSYGE